MVPNTSDIPKSSIFLAFPKPLGGILNEIIDDLSVTLMEITGDPAIGCAKSQQISYVSLTLFTSFPKGQLSELIF